MECPQGGGPVGTSSGGVDGPAAWMVLEEEVRRRGGRGEEARGENGAWRTAGNDTWELRQRGGPVADGGPAGSAGHVAAAAC